MAVEAANLVRRGDARLKLVTDCYSVELICDGFPLSTEMNFCSFPSFMPRNEHLTCVELIDPKIFGRGWNEALVREEKTDYLLCLPILPARPGMPRARKSSA
jgi:hypothetical protein